MNFSGVSSYSDTGLVAFSFRLALIREDVGRKITLLMISQRNRAAQLLSEIMNGLKTYLFEKEKIDLSFLYNYEESALFLALSNSFFFESNGPRLYYFPTKEEIDVNRGLLKDNLYIGLLTPSSSYTLNELSIITKEPLTPSILTEYLEDVKGLSTSITALRVRGKEKDLKGNRALACDSDRGLIRENNEDTCLSSSIEVSWRGISKRFQIIGVADGAGGHGYGEIASREGMYESFSAICQGILNDQPEKEILSKSISLANQSVLNKKSLMESDMASTLTLALLRGNDIFIGHVGDSRAYLIEPESIKRLTEDHKLVEEMLKRGEITEEEARTHPMRNIITSALGMPKPRVDVMAFRDSFNWNKSILVSSDGLSDMVDDRIIADEVRKAWHPEIAAKHLIREANLNGGIDNISISLLSHMR